MKEKSILIVDDELICVKFLIEILGADYCIYAAKDGNSAIGIAKKEIPDLILLDVNMPDMDGFEVLSSLKMVEETKDIPVIFVSGYTDSDEKEKGLALGARDFILKSGDAKVIREKVGKHINN